MLSGLKNAIKDNSLIDYYGKITKVVGLTVESSGPPCSIGEICYIQIGNGESIPCEVTGFNDDKLILMPFKDIQGISVGDKVYTTGNPFRIRLGKDLIGKVLNGLGEPLDGTQAIKGETQRDIHGKIVSALDRKLIREQLQLGVKSIDGILSCGKGQRIGIFAGSGVGKSTLLGMIAKNTKADINVIALIGERGREVREFLEHELGEEGLKRSIVVVAESHEPAIVKIKGAMIATTIAEYFRDQGLDVILMMDSVTRFAMAQREIGTSMGEKVAQRGYTPSVFAMLPKLLERAGTSDKGTITGLYTVLVDGGDMEEPVADTVRGILDGHIVLTRKLAQSNHYPAIDPLQSVSRVMRNIVGEDQVKKAGKLTEILAIYKEIEDMLSIGAYKRGVIPKNDYAIDMYDKCNEFLKQGINEAFELDETLNLLDNLFKE